MEGLSRKYHPDLQREINRINRNISKDIDAIENEIKITNEAIQLALDGFGEESFELFRDESIHKTT